MERAKTEAKHYQLWPMYSLQEFWTLELNNDNKTHQQRGIVIWYLAIT